MLKKKRSTKVDLLLLLIIFYTHGIFGGLASSEELSQPDIQFEETVYDFGEIEQKEKVTVVYNFKNVGRNTLIISNVKSSCGCIATLLSSKEIATDGVGEIKVTFDAEERQGKVMRRISVYSNDPDQPIIKLTIKGFIKAEVIAEPKRLYFGKIEKRSLATQKLKLYILQGGEKDIRIRSVQSASEYIITTDPLRTVKEDKEGYMIEVGLKPEVPIGRFSSKVKIFTDGVKRPEIHVVVNADIRGDIIIKPSVLVFPLASKKDETTRTIKVSNIMEEDLKILKVEADVEYISTEVSSIEEGHIYEIKTQVMPDVPAKTVKGMIGIHINYPKQPVINVPVYIFNKPDEI